MVMMEGSDSNYLESLSDNKNSMEGSDYYVMDMISDVNSGKGRSEKNSYVLGSKEDGLADIGRENGL